MSKQCTVGDRSSKHCCGEIKPLSAFRLDVQLYEHEVKDIPPYYSSQCVKCLYADYVEAWTKRMAKDADCKVRIRRRLERLCKEEEFQNTLSDFMKSQIETCNKREEQRWCFSRLTIDEAWNKWVEQQGKCALCKKDMDWISRDPNCVRRKHEGEWTSTFYSDTPSIDRIDASHGRLSYAGNMQWVHAKCNMWKGIGYDRMARLEGLLKQKDITIQQLKDAKKGDPIPEQVERLTKQNYQLAERLQASQTGRLMDQENARKQKEEEKEKRKERFQNAKYGTKAYWEKKYFELAESMLKQDDGTPMIKRIKHEEGENSGPTDGPSYKDLM